eukprot:1195988-Prorocentrum_minimum.AAC.3
MYVTARVISLHCTGPPVPITARVLSTPQLRHTLDVIGLLIGVAEAALRVGTVGLGVLRDPHMAAPPAHARPPHRLRAGPVRARPEKLPEGVHVLLQLRRLSEKRENN